MPAPIGPVRWNTQRAGVYVLDDGLVVRRDSTGLADTGFQARLASLILLLAAVVVALLRINATLVLVLLGLAVLPVLVYAVLVLLAVVGGVGALATRQGRRAAQRGMGTAFALLNARTVARSLAATPEHLAVVPRTDIVGVEISSRSLLVLQTRRGPHEIRARWWHPRVLGHLNRALSDPSARVDRP